MMHPVGSKTTQSNDLASAQELVTSAREIVTSLTLLPMSRSFQSPQDLINLMSSREIPHLIILDQKVTGIEKIGTKTNYGYEYVDGDRRLTVIDHHVADPLLSSLSTGNLVLEYFKQHPEGPPKDAAIAITHGDCDSLVSALMILKKIPPEEKFAVAVMSADHNFQQNPIADLLQAIEASPKAGETVQGLALTKAEILTRDPLNEFRAGLTEHDFQASLQLSIESLGLLLQGKDLSPEVANKLEQRLTARETWKTRIAEHQITTLENGTCYCVIPETIKHDPCPEFLQALLPNAKVILVFHNDPANLDFKQVRAILGNAAPEGIVLNDGKIITTELIPGFGGRKDAGSNRRSGISFTGDPIAVAKEIDLNLGKQL